MGYIIYIYIYIYIHTYIYIYISVLGSSVVRSLASGAKGPWLNFSVHTALSEIYFFGIYV